MQNYRIFAHHSQNKIFMLAQRGCYLLSGYLILFLAFNWVSAKSYGQTELNQVDAMGRKQGMWQKNYPDGKIRYRGEFKNDIPVGEFRYYHPNGKTRAILWHRGDGIHSEVELYDVNGRLSARGFYTKETKDSVWQYFNPITGKISARECYHQGVPHGEWKVYFMKDTMVSEQWNYSHGKKEGEWKMYYPDGSLKLKTSYRNNLLEGEYKIFYPKGEIKTEGIYKKGERNGEWKYYTMDGKLKRKEWYEGGNLIREEILIPDTKDPDTPLDPSLDPEKINQTPE